MRTRVGLCCVMLAVCAGRAQAAEYFVGKGGNDAHDGLGRERAFLTVQKGVDALQTGDTLTITSGEYLEIVRRGNLGGAEVETVIRAEISGTVLIRGDVPLPAFRKLDGYRFVYETDVDLKQAIQTVNDLDSLALFHCTPSLPGLDYRPGSFYHVPNANKLYLTTADFSPAETRRFSASVRNEAGIQLADARRLRLEGLSVTGFRGAGILLLRPRDCVIRDCRAYLNQQGVTIDSQASGGPMGGGNIIERCTAWANMNDGLSANVQNEDTIRYSLAFLNGGSGMRLYAGAPHVSRMHDNLAWGNGSDFFMKSGISRHQVERCTGPDRWPHESAGSDIRHCLLGLLDRGPSKERDFVSNIQLLELVRHEPNVDWGAEFADPANHDYRLQATSRFRGAAADGGDLGAYPYRPNIFYVSPDGSDAADGLSAARAFATLERAGRELKPDDTLYLSPGRYAGSLRIAGKAGEGRIQVRGRGAAPAELAGPVHVENARGVSLERLRFTSPVTVAVDGDVNFEQCAFAGDAGLTAQRVDGLRVIHCVFSGSGDSQIALGGCTDVFLSGNRFDNARGAAVVADRPEAVLYSDYNAYHLAASAWRLGGKEAAPGDTVRVAGGVYHECLYIRATGLPGRPITFSSRLGERVTLDGGVNRELQSLLVAFDKSHLRIDGFSMRNVTMAGGTPGVIRWFGGEDVRITRVLQEDRVNGWPGGLFNVRRVSDMLVRNCRSKST